MADVVYREARSEDIPAMADVFLASLTGMYARNNIAGEPPPRPALLSGYKHILSTGIFYLAEVETQVVAIGSAIIRDRIWFLSTFWARPDQQGKGVGMLLLRRLWQEGKTAGATTFFTHSSPDITAMAAYMKLGMLPGYQIIYFKGQPQRLSGVPIGYETVPLEKTVAMELDQQVRGTRRDLDHELWLGTGGLQGRQVLRHGKVAGYYYFGRSGIGPAAWNEAQHAEVLLTMACRDSATVMPEIRFSVPGINHAAIRFALNSGFHVTGIFHHLTMAPFGRMEHYLPSGPALY